LQTQLPKKSGGKEERGRASSMSGRKKRLVPKGSEECSNTEMKKESLFPLLGELRLFEQGGGKTWTAYIISTKRKECISRKSEGKGRSDTKRRVG